MKIFYSENTVDYSSYTFNYAIYCEKENQAEIPDIYHKGFLPYTGNLSLKKNVFYLARSLRVDLDRFEDSSENRRVNRKIEELNVQFELIDKADFDVQDPTFLKFCAAYAADRFSGNSMPEDRLRYVLDSELATHILHFYNDEQTMGYIVACMVGNIFHYWYAFFNTEYMKSHSLGKWMMWRTISWAQEKGLKHVYLGTCYGKHSLYKVRDHKGLAFFDGARWNEDTRILKDWCKTDADPLPSDRFKLKENPNAFLKEIS